MLLKGRTRQFVQAYIEQWRRILRKPGPELAEFFDHVQKRVLLDNDPPHIRQGLCLVGMTIAEDLVRAGKHVADASTSQYSDLAELFGQIAEGPEVTVNATSPRGDELVLKFADGVRTAIEPAHVVWRPQDVIWKFDVGRNVSGPQPPHRGYITIASAEGLEWIEGLSAPPPTVIENWIALFERIAWRVLLNHHDPFQLRRSYASFAQVLLISLESFVEEHGCGGESPLTPDADMCLRDIFGQIADGGSLKCAAFWRDGTPIFSAAFDHHERVASFAPEYADVDPDALISALRTLSEDDVTQAPEPIRAPPKARAKPRPNEACHCGSGRKYKKCCGLH